MPTVRDVLDALELIAPARFALDWDKVGLQVGDPSAQVSRAVVSLDASREAIRFAAEHGAQMIVAHHPLVFRPLEGLRYDNPVSALVARLVKQDIAFAAAHTNWDAATGGVNDALASKLGLTGVAAFGQSAESRSLKMVVFCPVGSEQAVIEAASEQGAGIIGAYERCAFLSEGIGTFRPTETASPAIGAAGKVERVDEIRVEMVVPVDRLAMVEQAVRNIHPYEEPAIDWLVLHTGSRQPLGRVGDLAQSISSIEFQSWVDERLQTRSLAWNLPPTIRRVAVIGGAGDSDWKAAQECGADVLLTGEVKHHSTLEGCTLGLVAAGHYATEQPGCEALAERLAASVSNVDWKLFVPEPGQGGRPL